MAKLLIAIGGDYETEGKATEFKVDNASGEAIAAAIANTGSMESSGEISSTLAEAFRKIDNIRAVKPETEEPEKKGGKKKPN